MAAPDIERLLEEERGQELHPGLAPLMGLGGGGARLDTELRQAWAGLALARSQWLRWEGLWAGLQELLRQDPPTFRKLEQTLMLSQLRWGDPPMTSLPPPEDPAPLRRLVLPALQRHLGQKAAELADYHGGGASPPPPGGAVWGGAEGVASEPRPPGVAQALANETLRLRHARRRGHALRELLSRQSRLLPEVLGRIAAILGRIAGKTGEWTERDRRRGRYLEAKGVALLLKIRLEELRVLLDTYRPGVVEAHRSIRSLLQSEAARAAAESSRLRGALSAFRSLGPGFESRAREYGRLRQQLRHRRWALRQLRPHHP